VATYNLKPVDQTALISEELLARWRSATEEAGLNNTQAMIVALTLLYADPKAWNTKTPEGEKPPSNNFHVRLPGIVGTWLEEIRKAQDTKAEISGTLQKTSKTKILETAMIYFADMTESGSLMSTMAVIMPN
jgi:hypothetical protein